MTTNPLGHHRRIAHPGALTKHEVAAYLMKRGHELGFWCIPEYEIYGASGGLRKIDVVWATRNDAAADSIWTPVAAFEIEGHDVSYSPKTPDKDSMVKNADSLAAALRAGARFSTVVLFHAGPEGTRWGRPIKTDAVARATAILNQHLPSGTPQIPVITDSNLPAHLKTLMAELHAQRA